MRRTLLNRIGLLRLAPLGSAAFLAMFTLGAGLASPQLSAVPTSSAPPVFLMERYYSAPQSQKGDPLPRVGDILRFRWIGEAKPSTSAVEVVLRDEDKTLASLGWEVYSHPKDDPTSAFALIPLRPGALELPSLAVRDAEKKVLGVTQPLKLEIAPAASQEELQKKAPDFLPPVAMKLPLKWLILIAVAGIITLGLALWFGRRLGRRFRKKPIAKTVDPPRVRLSEDEEALRFLDKLEKDQLWLEQRFKPHYFGVSEALKKYIERRYGFDAAECTTREMLRGLSERGLEQSKVVVLSELFEKLDRVKFTDFVPESQECMWILSEARGWIRATRLVASRTGGADAV